MSSLKIFFYSARSARVVMTQIVQIGGLLVSLWSSRMLVEGRAKQGPQPNSRRHRIKYDGGLGAEPPAARDINDFNELLMSFIIEPRM